MSQSWELNKRNKGRFLILQMDFWRSSRIAKLQYVRNKRIRRIMKVQDNILDSVVTRRLLLCYRYLQRIQESRKSIRVFEFVSPERRKRGRPPINWRKEIEEGMNSRGLQEGDWNDRKRWRLSSGQRRQS